MKSAWRHLVRITAAAAIALVGERSGAAEPQPLYVELGVGLDDGRVDCLSEFACDHRDRFGKLAAGFRFSPVIDVQVAWFDAGRFKGADVTPLGTRFNGKFDVSGGIVSAGFTRPLIEGVDATVRAGPAVMRTSFDYADPAYGSDRHKTTLQPYAGAALSYAVTPAIAIGLSYDLTRFKAHDDNGLLQLFGVSARYSF